MFQSCLSLESRVGSFFFFFFLLLFRVNSLSLSLSLTHSLSHSLSLSLSLSLSHSLSHTLSLFYRQMCSHMKVNMNIDSPPPSLSISLYTVCLSSVLFDTTRNTHILYIHTSKLRKIFKIVSFIIYLFIQDELYAVIVNK